MGGTDGNGDTGRGVGEGMERGGGGLWGLWGGLEGSKRDLHRDPQRSEWDGGDGEQRRGRDGTKGDGDGMG